MSTRISSHVRYIQPFRLCNSYDFDLAPGDVVGTLDCQIFATTALIDVHKPTLRGSPVEVEVQCGAHRRNAFPVNLTAALPGIWRCAITVGDHAFTARILLAASLVLGLDRNPILAPSWIRF